MSVCIVELFFSQRLFKNDNYKDKVKMLSFFNNFLCLFESVEDLAKGSQVCITTRSLVMLIEQIHIIHRKVLGDCHFFPRKRHSNPKENVT